MFKGKNFLVLGIGRSGQAVARVLKDLGFNVTISDAKTEQELNKDFSSLLQAGIKLALGNQNPDLLNGVDSVILSPGISINIPLIQEAQKRNLEIMSEVEVAYRLCPAPIVAITGTNGKTTTTTLTGEMLKMTAKPVVVGGNIGTALSQEIAGIGSNGVVVAEISSFQLEAVSEFHPFIAAILNITPDHIDRHGSFENYQFTKERIFANQQIDDYLILNYDDPQVREMGSKTKSQVVYFSTKHELNEGVFVQGTALTIKWQGNQSTVCQVKDMKLFGTHNVENALAACAVAFFAGVRISDMAKVLKSFTGVEHRIEPVKEVNGVMYYNDSKATNPESAIKALEAFSGNIILIAGGRDKMTDLTAFMKLIKTKVDHLILLGEAQERFSNDAKKHDITNIHAVNSLDEAVKLAHQLAKSPQVVLLSPACASYDMFTSYEHRGKVFKELVQSL